MISIYMLLTLQFSIFVLCHHKSPQIASRQGSTAPPIQAICSWWDLQPTMPKGQIPLSSLESELILAFSLQCSCSLPLRYFNKMSMKARTIGTWTHFSFCPTVSLNTQGLPKNGMRSWQLPQLFHRYPKKRSGAFSPFHFRNKWRHSALVVSCKTSFKTN